MRANKILSLHFAKLSMIARGVLIQFGAKFSYSCGTVFFFFFFFFFFVFFFLLFVFLFLFFWFFCFFGFCFFVVVFIFSTRKKFDFIADFFWSK